jgi:hypothetical protein
MNSLVIKVDDETPYVYECHSMHKAAEIIASSYEIVKENGSVITDIRMV